MDKFFRTNSSILVERLDPNFYQPSLVENDKLIKSKGWVELQSLYEASGIGNTSAVERYYSEAADSIPYISGKVIKSFNIDLDECQRISLDSHKNELTKSALKPTDVLVIRKGDMGNACVVPSEVNEANCSSEVIYLKMKASSDPYYLVSYLNCDQGQKAFKRLGRGTIIPGVSLLDVPRLPIPKVSEFVQKYIGDKVRQAEQLRAWAKLLRTSVDAHLNSLNLPINEPPALLNRVSAQTMEDRLDPRPYRTHYLCLVREIEKLPHDSISTLVELASGCPVSSNDFLENSGIPLVRIRNIGFDDFIGLDTGVSQDVYQDATKYQAKDKMIVVGMDGIFRSQFFISDELPMLVNQRVAMLSPQNIRGELLTHWLNRPEGQMQLNQWVY
ncbi:restriction endonuclease subunit S [Escherichia coli]|uniref:restriction endonuclease subunit S n=1 Tax=Escherichia coli TaxID=562 RepID=UPI00288340F1|nr:restriction endonuclease subunit S [Escherichia coli]